MTTQATDLWLQALWELNSLNSTQEIHPRDQLQSHLLNSSHISDQSRDQAKCVTGISQSNTNKNLRNSSDNDSVEISNMGLLKLSCYIQIAICILLILDSFVMKSDTLQTWKQFALLIICFSALVLMVEKSTNDQIKPMFFFLQVISFGVQILVSNYSVIITLMFASLQWILVIQVINTHPRHVQFVVIIATTLFIPILHWFIIPSMFTIELLADLIVNICFAISCVNKASIIDCMQKDIDNLEKSKTCQKNQLRGITTDAQCYVDKVSACLENVIESYQNKHISKQVLESINVSQFSGEYISMIIKSLQHDQQAKNPEQRKTKVNIVDLVKKSIQMVNQNNNSSRSVQVQIQVDRNIRKLNFVQADAFELIQIVSKLASYAINTSKDQGTVTVQLGWQDSLFQTDLNNTYTTINLSKETQRSQLTSDTATITSLVESSIPYTVNNGTVQRSSQDVSKKDSTTELLGLLHSSGRSQSYPDMKSVSEQSIQQQTDHNQQQSGEQINNRQLMNKRNFPKSKFAQAANQIQSDDSEESSSMMVQSCRSQVRNDSCMDSNLTIIGSSQVQSKLKSSQQRSQDQLKKIFSLDSSNISELSELSDIPIDQTLAARPMLASNRNVQPQQNFHSLMKQANNLHYSVDQSVEHQPLKDLPLYNTSVIQQPEDQDLQDEFVESDKNSADANMQGMKNFSFSIFKPLKEHLAVQLEQKRQGEVVQPSQETGSSGQNNKAMVKKLSSKNLSDFSRKTSHFLQAINNSLDENCSNKYSQTHGIDSQSDCVMSLKNDMIDHTQQSEGSSEPQYEQSYPMLKKVPIIKSNKIKTQSQQYEIKNSKRIFNQDQKLPYIAQNQQHLSPVITDIGSLSVSEISSQIVQTQNLQKKIEQECADSSQFSTFLNINQNDSTLNNNNNNNNAQHNSSLMSSYAALKFGFLTINVINQSQGIPENQQKDFFEKLDANNDNQDDLNLKICKQLVDSMNGQIELLSEQRVGSLFKVRIKLRGAQPASSGSESPRFRSSGQGMSISNNTSLELSKHKIKTHHLKSTLNSPRNHGYSQFRKI